MVEGSSRYSVVGDVVLVIGVVDGVDVVQVVVVLVLVVLVLVVLVLVEVVLDVVVEGGVVTLAVTGISIGRLRNWKAHWRQSQSASKFNDPRSTSWEARLEPIIWAI